MFWYLVYIIILFIIIQTIVLQYEKRKRNLQGPILFPILGNLPDFLLKKTALRWCESGFSRYGKTFLALLKPTLGRGVNKWLIWTIDPENIVFITSEIKLFTRSLPEFESSREWKLIRMFFGSGIFVADGDLWELQRHVAADFFKKNSLDCMKEVFQEKTNLVKSILENHEKEGTPVDVQHIFFSYTFDSFLKIGFGVEMDCLRKNMEFPKYFDFCLHHLRETFLNPLAIFNDKYFVEAVAKLDADIYKFIDNSQENGSDLLSKFKSLKNAHGEPYPKSWIRDILVNFLIAGRDTTASLIMWTFYALATHPEVEEKLFSEIYEVCGDSLPTNENLKNLKYLDMILNETLRLFPSVPSTVRSVSATCVLPDGTKLFRGDAIFYVPYFLQRTPEFYDKPEEYIPERWRKKSNLTEKGRYVPFHRGPMQCLGRHMAKIEAKILICGILQKYQLKLVSKEIEPYFGIILSNNKKMDMSVHERKKL